MTETLLALLITPVLVLAAGLAAPACLLLPRPHAAPRDPAFDELARLQAETAGRLQQMGEALAGRQAETAGRLQAMNDALTTRQAELARVLSERLDSVTSRLGASLETNTQQTVERLRTLHE